ncbi:MAG: 30S ribosome-binding factor RbfA [Desulforudis sp.]|nr:30S ribosome-binding factor RbfA [Clostridia bacterium]MDQ7790842.1 30S ribosome-binding factor RbfA [Clostridia bacterium]RJX22694.1 MAG: 30S ribosome-binding factor RbfA [Desulforudis sp.]
MAYRPERLGEVLKQELAELLRQLKDPRIGFVTVTSVDVSNDLRYVKVFVSVLGSPEEQKATMTALEKAQGYLRAEIGRRIRLRYTPEVSFKLDHSISEGVRLVELIDEITEGKPGDRDDR